MRRLLFAALAAAVAAVSLFALSGGSSTVVQATHGIFNAHVHDDYFHPTGSFVPGPGHVTAQALCMGANPDPTCTATVHVGDSVQWVAPAPLAVNPHSVTECTDGTWTVCGANVDPANPIGDSGVLFQPGWPYVVQFNASDFYYYRCEVHPLTMRGVVRVLAPPGVGGTVDILAGDDGSGGLSATYLAASAALAVVALAFLGLAARKRFATAREESAPDRLD
jgi:plastocyanin